MKVQKSALVLYSADLMYELVNRVDAYPEFLPWCGGAQVFEESEDSMVAEIVIDFKGYGSHLRPQTSSFDRSIRLRVSSSSIWLMDRLSR